MKTDPAAVENLLRAHRDIRRGGWHDTLEMIARDVGGAVPASPFRCEFRPTATRWDPASRTVHLYEISSSEPFPDGTFEAIKQFAEWLHDRTGCFTALWVANGDGCHPMKVWDVRDELIWVR